MLYKIQMFVKDRVKFIWYILVAIWNDMKWDFSYMRQLIVTYIYP